MILTEGGRLAFFGTPDEAKAYFKVARLGDVYRLLAEHKPGSLASSLPVQPAVSIATLPTGCPTR